MWAKCISLMGKKRSFPFLVVSSFLAVQVMKLGSICLLSIFFFFSFVQWQNVSPTPSKKKLLLKNISDFHEWRSTISWGYSSSFHHFSILFFFPLFPHHNIKMYEEGFVFFGVGVFFGEEITRNWQLPILVHSMHNIISFI